MNFAILSFIIGFILQFEALFLLLPWIVGMIISCGTDLSGDRSCLFHFRKIVKLQTHRTF